MRVKVLKSFPFAESRQRTRTAEVDEVLTIADEDVLAGLIDGGYVDEAAEEAAEPVEIPFAWETLDKRARLDLASRIAGKQVKAEKTAGQIIAAEVARREEA